MCCTTVLANYLFCLVSVILKQSHITQVFYHTRSLSHARFLVVLFFCCCLFKWWAFTQLARALLIGENGGALNQLVSKIATQACCHAFTLEQRITRPLGLGR